MMPSVISSSVTLEAARTFVPGWWLQAFEASVTSTRDSTYNGVSVGTLLPRFDSAELGVLALILGDIQRQIIAAERNDSAVELDWVSAQKHLSGVDATAKERLTRVIEALP